MDGKTLTGKDAVEAIGLCMRLGAADARFDARKVTRAIRTSVGRRRVIGAFFLSRFVRPLSAPSRPRSSRRVARPLGAAVAASPGRPAPRSAA